MGQRRYDVGRLHCDFAGEGPAETRYAVEGKKESVLQSLRLGYPATKPPSMGMAWPLTNEAASEHSQMTASATSSERPRRPAGCSRLRTA